MAIERLSEIGMETGLRVGMIVHSYLPFDRAGVPLYVDRLLRGLNNSKQFVVKCITPNHSRNLLMRRYRGYSIFYIPMWPRIYTMIRWLLFFAYALLKHGSRIVSQEKIDILHGHTTIYAGFQTVLLGQITKRPVVLTLHGSDEQGPFLPLISKADLIIVQRNELREKLIRSGIDPRRIRLVPNCIETGNSVFEKLPNRSPIITFVARIVSFRRPDLYIDALAKVIQSFPDTRGVVMGDGLMLEGIKNQAVELGIENSIEFTGVVEDPFEKLSEGDIFVACSDIENFSSTSLLEAMEKGMAVVATDVGETRELVINEQNGLVVQVSGNDLAVAIERLLQDDQLRQKLCKNAQHTVRNQYSQENLLEWHKSAYLSIARKNRTEYPDFYD
jgi:glycosyltransferase involved in cell wall biosynthesis